MEQLGGAGGGWTGARRGIKCGRLGAAGKRPRLRAFSAAACRPCLFGCHPEPIEGFGPGSAGWPGVRNRDVSTALNMTGRGSVEPRVPAWGGRGAAKRAGGAGGKGRDASPRRPNIYTDGSESRPYLGRPGERTVRRAVPPFSIWGFLLRVGRGACMVGLPINGKAHTHVY